MELMLTEWLWLLRPCAKLEIQWGATGTVQPASWHPGSWQAGRKLAIRAPCAQGCDGVSTGGRGGTRQHSQPKPGQAEKASSMRSVVCIEGSTMRSVSWGKSFAEPQTPYFRTPQAQICRGRVLASLCLRQLLSPALASRATS